MTGNATDILISSFLTSLKIIFINSGISHDLIAAGADIMEKKQLKLKFQTIQLILWELGEMVIIL